MLSTHRFTSRSCLFYWNCCQTNSSLNRLIRLFLVTSVCCVFCWVVKLFFLPGLCDCHSYFIVIRPHITFSHKAPAEHHVYVHKDIRFTRWNIHCMAFIYMTKYIQSVFPPIVTLRATLCCWNSCTHSSVAWGQSENTRTKQTTVTLKWSNFPSNKQSAGHTKGHSEPE